MDNCCEKKSRDYLLWGCGGASILAALLHLIYPLGMESALGAFCMSAYSLLATMWWGIAIGILFLALLSTVPKELAVAALGKERGLKGLLRACLAGVLLDLCSHGILMVGAKLYQKGVSFGQTAAFLIASPWNSISLTVILFALIGVKWTLAFILLSLVVGVITGALLELLTDRGFLPQNPNQLEQAPKSFREEFAAYKKGFSPSWQMLWDGARESQMVLRWLFLGVVIASLMKAFLPQESYTTYLGPTLFGQLITLVFATVLEVCSEGSTPIAAEIFHIAKAPGNAFLFLMAGAVTDYTEILVLREATGSWKLPFMIPLLAVPQILALAYLLNLC